MMALTNSLAVIAALSSAAGGISAAAIAPVLML